MSSTNSTIDGMGGEEMNQVQIQSSNIMITGSIVAGELGSFAGDLYGDDVYGASINDGDGTLRSALIGSSTSKVWSGFVQAGSFSTTAGSVGFIKLGMAFPTAPTGYYVTATPTGSSAGALWSGYTSGLKHTSGVNFIGAASLRYDFVAVGV